MSRRIKKNVGIIGLGIIGRRIAEHLRRQGFSVFVWNRTPRPFPNFVGSPAELAQLTDFIQIFVSDDAALLGIVQQLKMALKAQHVVMAHCTVAPHTMREAAEIVQRRGAQFLDAPFTGSKMAAEKGELVYYIGGNESAFRQAKPVLEASSKEIIEIGEIGHATTIKVATNMITAATVQVAAEALAVVQNSGMAPEKFAAAMRGNASNSVTLTMKLPKMIARDFEPHFSVKHMLKDVEIASRLARSYGISLEATEAARRSLQEEMRHDRGDYDFTSLMRVIIPPTKDEQQPETKVSDHPMLDLKEAAPREESVPLPKESAVSAEAVPQLLDPLIETAESAPVSAATEMKLTEDKPAEEAKIAMASEERIEPEVQLFLKDKVVPVPDAPAEQNASLDRELALGEPFKEEPAQDVTTSTTDAAEPAEIVEPVPEKLLKRDEVAPRPMSEPEVDHLVLSAQAYTEVMGDEKRSPKQMWDDDETFDDPVEKPLTGKSAADALPFLDAQTVSDEKAEPEEERRGFFSRLFSKTSHGKDPEY